MQEKDRQLTKLQGEIDDLRDMVAKSEDYDVDADASERRDTFIFPGNDVLLLPDGENCTQIACDLVKKTDVEHFTIRHLSLPHRLSMPRYPSNLLYVCVYSLW